ncbi:MAG: hypothetical protein ABL909_07970 [Sphingopyxis sp.]
MSGGAGQWSFVVAAYAVTALGTVAVLWQSWQAMRAAERQVDALSASKDESAS